MDLVLFGIQGSGKGTQAKRLAAEFGYDIFEMGAELRKIAATPTALGESVKACIDKGNLAPIEIVLQVMHEAIVGWPADKKILFDGVPRNDVQAAGFDKAMAEAGRQFKCIHLMIPRSVAFERVHARAQMEGRADDATAEFINRRMDIFEHQTKGVIAMYAEHDLMTEVDGLGEVDDVYLRLKTVVATMQ